MKKYFFNADGSNLDYLDDNLELMFTKGVVVDTNLDLDKEEKDSLSYYLTISYYHKHGTDYTEVTGISVDKDLYDRGEKLYLEIDEKTTFNVERPRDY